MEGCNDTDGLLEGSCEGVAVGEEDGLELLDGASDGSVDTVGAIEGSDEVLGESDGWLETVGLSLG